jgi:hypothetical protein
VAARRRAVVFLAGLCLLLPLASGGVTDGSIDAAEIDLAAGGTLPLAPSGREFYVATLTPGQVLHGYAPDDAHHNFVGFLNLNRGGAGVVRYNLFINVLDDEIPEVPVEALGSDCEPEPPTGRFPLWPAGSWAGTFRAVREAISPTTSSPWGTANTAWSTTMTGRSTSARTIWKEAAGVNETRPRLTSARPVPTISPGLL